MILAPMTDEDLRDSSAAIVLGRVDAVSAAVGPAGEISTYVTIAVEEQIKGAFEPTLTVVVPGGTVGNVSRVVGGAPAFHAGERVLVFLRHRVADGALVPNGLALGKYAILRSPTGDIAQREFGRAAAADVRPLGAFMESIRGISAGAPARRDPGDTAAQRGSAQLHAAFLLAGTPARWTEPDRGSPVAYAIDPTGDAQCGPAASQEAATLALSAWSNAGGSLRLLDGGPAAPAPFAVCDGVSTILFNDPFDEIGPLVNCTGVLAIAGFCSTEVGGSIVNGIVFERITEGDVMLNKGLADCPFWNATSLAEVLTHELGHTIGLGHSSEDPDELDPLLRDATMYFRAHFDGRGATLRADDIAGVRALYPLEATPRPTPTATATPELHPSAPASVGSADGGGCAIAPHRNTGLHVWQIVGLVAFAVWYLRSRRRLATI